MKIRTHLISFNTIVIKEVSRFTRIWIQTIVPPAVSMALYFIVFGHLIGPRIGAMQGVGYIDFISPGIIMMAVINNSYANVVSSFFSAKFQRHVEEILVAPVSSFTILAGFVAGGAARGLAVGLVVTVIALCFTDLHISSYLIVIAVVFLAAVLFSIAGLLNAIFAKKFDDISIVPTFVLTPLIYLGGVFYSIELLPGFWQKISLFNPILYMVNAFRYGMLGISDINIYTAFAIICAFILVLAGYALYLLHEGIGIKS